MHHLHKLSNQRKENFHFKGYSGGRHDFIVGTMENMQRAEKLGGKKLKNVKHQDHSSSGSEISSSGSDLSKDCKRSNSFCINGKR